MKGWLAGMLVVVITNVAALLPVYRARSGDVRHIPATVCSAHLTGGYGETDRLRLSVRPELSGPITGLDADGMQALGFSATETARLGDSTVSSGRLPSARAAWVRLQQTSDSGRGWRAVAVGPTRESVMGDGLIVRGRVGFGYQTVAPEGLRLAGQLFATEPTELHVGASETLVLRPLRQRGERCTTSAAVILDNGADGSLWVSSVR